MKRQLPTLKSIRSSVLFLLLLACSAIVSGQQETSNILPAHQLTASRQKAVIARPIAHIAHPRPHNQQSVVTVCDTDLFMDYAAYNEVTADLSAGLTYTGSWYTGTSLYAQPLSYFVTTASGDSGYFNYAGVVFDSLVFSNPIDTSTGYLPLATSTVYFDSLGMYLGLSGDTAHMTTDSIFFYIFSIPANGGNPTLAQTIIYHGWAQIKRFYEYGGDFPYNQIPVHYQLTQGESFAVEVKYHNKNAADLLSLAYSYADSCTTVVYQGATYSSPAYPSPFLGNDFWGSINYDTTGVVDAQDNSYGYFGLGFPVNCSYDYTQNFALFPVITVCSAVTAPAATITPTEVSCYGQSTGSATVNATGGNGTFTYAWSTGATTAAISNLAVGTYIVTVTSNSETVTDTVVITQPTSALVTAPTSTATSCTANSGTAAANASGGTTAYTYVWSNSATAASITGLGAATFTVTVTDSKGCSATGTTTISPPSSFGVTTVPTNVNCFGQNTGGATANTSGTTGTLTYNWSNGVTTQSISNVVANTYTVTVTETNCSSTGSATITQPATAVSASATSTITQCGSGTGTATVTAGGGTPGYTYAWSNSGTTTTISSLGVGNYNVTVTDLKSCTATATTSVNTSATFIINVTPTNVNCFGQSTGGASATVTGANGTIVYVWSNGATTQSISSLPAGTYNVTVTDVSNCPKTGSTTVTQPVSALAVTVVTAPTNCTSNTGTATATVTGGTPNYAYAWSNSATTNPASGLGVGNISLTVTDNNSCTVTSSGAVSFPPTFTVSATSTPASCNGQTSGSVTAMVSGNSTYTYSWSNGGSSATVANIAAANYSVTVTDAFGCTGTASASVSQPAAISVSVTPTDATNGANGTATAATTGGTSPYQYSWSNQDTLATDTGLAAGSYTVTVTDANNCSGTASTTIIATGINLVPSNITSITLIPNPATDQVKVVVSLATAQTVEFRLVDITGKYIYTAHESAVQGTITHQINLGEYAAGIYLVEIAAGNDVTRRKLVITK